MLHFPGAFPGGEPGRGRVSVEPRLGHGVREYDLIAQVFPFREVAPKERFQKAVLGGAAPLHVGPAQQTVGRKGIGHARGPLEV